MLTCIVAGFGERIKTRNAKEFWGFNLVPHEGIRFQVSNFLAVNTTANVKVNILYGSLGRDNVLIVY